VAFGLARAPARGVRVVHTAWYNNAGRSDSLCDVDALSLSANSTHVGKGTPMRLHLYVFYCVRHWHAPVHTAMSPLGVFRKRSLCGIRQGRGSTAASRWSDVPSCLPLTRLLTWRYQPLEVTGMHLLPGGVVVAVRAGVVCLCTLWRV
jgi:hypothetical protein